MRGAAGSLIGAFDAGLWGTAWYTRCPVLWWGERLVGYCVEHPLSSAIGEGGEVGWAASQWRAPDAFQYISLDAGKGPEA